MTDDNPTHAHGTCEQLLRYVLTIHPEQSAESTPVTRNTFTAFDSHACCKSRKNRMGTGGCCSGNAGFQFGFVFFTKVVMLNTLTSLGIAAVR
jgi:hypothetical protein